MLHLFTFIHGWKWKALVTRWVCIKIGFCRIQFGFDVRKTLPKNWASRLDEFSIESGDRASIYSLLLLSLMLNLLELKMLRKFYRNNIYAITCRTSQKRRWPCFFFVRIQALAGIVCFPCFGLFVRFHNRINFHLISSNFFCRLQSSPMLNNTIRNTFIRWQNGREKKENGYTQSLSMKTIRN